MKKIPHVLTLEDGWEHGSVFHRKGWETSNLNDVGRLDKYDLICLVGGADVDPDLYGMDMHPSMFCDPAQDEMVWEYLFKAKVAGVPVVGICKGAQQLCVYNGGKLHQHVSGHEGGHLIVDSDTGEAFYTKGSHHQMMDLDGSGGVVLAYAEAPDTDRIFEPEVVYFSEIPAIGFQYHPEWMDEGTRGVDYFFEKIKEYLL